MRRIQKLNQASILMLMNDETFYKLNAPFLCRLLIVIEKKKLCFDDYYKNMILKSSIVRSPQLRWI
jgi:hypothetical protein